MTDEHMPSATPQQRSRAVRAAAHHAQDAEELAVWLEMLGLDPEEGMRSFAPSPRESSERTRRSNGDGQHRLHDPRKRHTKIT